jgi:pyrroloquinoline quinone biosynthesis protein D
MPRPQDSSQPRLASGCRWTGEGDKRMLLFPEGVLKLDGTGRAILERCDGQHTFWQIVDELQTLYNASEPEKVRNDVGGFLERLQQKRVVDF